MKTNKLLIFGFLILIVVACSDKMYRIDTQINSAGSGVRTIYARGDSAFLSGDTSHTPYLFSYSPDWRFMVIDTLHTKLDKNYNVGIRKSFRSTDELNSGLTVSKEQFPLLTPVEQLKKHFRWFYTYYSFKVVYHHLSEQLPVSIDKYMTKEEQKCWFQGDFSGYSGMTGYECKNELDDVAAKFDEWWGRNEYEISFNTVRHFAKETGGNPYFPELENVKDTLFVVLNLKDSIKNGGNVDVVSPERICNTLDAYFHTTAFSTLFSENKDRITHYYDEQKRIAEEIPNKISLEYRLLLPGKVFNTNADWNRSDTLIWKVNGLRLYASEDYKLLAESRKTNVWAFILTFLAGLGALIFGIRKK
jgi:hypothetical protein